ncbi:hypothetical protein C0993_005002 [Termitomyces sp. T159_Od127]|nr:hypothetical protein C0993_005002 [Termitomyces sp. T159_Od127]
MHKVRRKPPPPIDSVLELDVALDVRYPTPDPNDPFAPLWVLRSRNSTNDLKKFCDPPRRAQTVPAVAFPIICDRVSTTSDSSNTTDTSHHSKWHSRLLRRVHVSQSPIPPSSSTSTASSFVHVSAPSCYDDPSSECALPSPAQLARAASLTVVAASGLRVPFASLFATRPTIVVFIRHFWCPHCQDYVSSISQTAPHLSGKSPVDLVLIGNGAPAFIPKYRALFGLECDIYTDPTLALYAELGMGRSSASGDYAMGGIAKIVLRTLKAGLPVWERGGDIHQLGGEFVFGPGLTCSYAHRMQSPKDHAPIRAVLSAAGVEVPPSIPPATQPKLLSSLRIKSWTPQKRARSLGAKTRDASESKTKPNRRKNASTGTYPLPSSPAKTPRTDSPSPFPHMSPSPSPVNEFGAWRRTGRISFDSSRASPERARLAHPLSHTTSPYQRHRQYASTGALPMHSPLSAEWGADSGQEDEEEEAEAEEAAWSPGELLPRGEEESWIRARKADLEALKQRKRERRAGGSGCFVPRVDSPGLSPDRGKRFGSPSLGRRGTSPTVACERLDEAEETDEETGRWRVVAQGRVGDDD